MTPGTLKRPVLYGPNNKPLAYGLYPSLSRDRKNYRPRPWLLGTDLRRQVTSYDRCELVDLSRQLFAQLGNLGTAIRDKNAWAFGDAWDPHYVGDNTAWGEAATRFLTQQFFPNCDRHGRHDWKTLLKLSGMAWDRDGDDAMILTEDDNGSGFPKIEIIPATRIGNGLGPLGWTTYTPAGNKVIGGAFDGYEIYDGIICDLAGKPVGIRILGRQQLFGVNTSKPSYQDFSLGYGGNVDLAYLPEWADQNRGIPLVGRVVLDWLDLQDIDVFLKRGIKRAASVGLTSKTTEGEAGDGNQIIDDEELPTANGDTKTVHYEEVEGGEMYYLHKDGEEITGIDYSTPHPNVEAFIARIERRGIAAVGWLYELIYIGAAQRAASRMACRVANNGLWQQQALGLKRTWRAVRYALAKAQKNGFIPRNPDPLDAYFAWEFGMPQVLSVDDGNDQSADRENLKMGTTNEMLIAQKQGNWWRAVSRQRLVELKTHVAEAAELEAGSGGKLTFDRALEMIQQRTANGALASSPGKPPAPVTSGK